MINSSRLLQEFMNLVKIDSPSGEERQVADYLKNKLIALGLEVIEDSTGQALGTNTGNLIARLSGTQDVPGIFFAAHMDTVPGRGIIPVVKNEVVYSAGNTILGADDKAGIAAILETVQVLQEQNIKYGPIEVIFTVGEEQGLRGAKSLDIKQVQASMGFVLDGDGEIGTIIVQGPCQNEIEVRIYGKAAHAGINPQDGINAIQVAARAINSMRLGRIDDETTANIGVIQGGEARNIVPDTVYLKGETRSLKRLRMDEETNFMEECLKKAAAQFGAKVEMDVELLYPEFSLKEEDLVVQIAQKAAHQIGCQPALQKSGGGSDANILNSRGIPTLNLGVGMRKVHTKDEHIFLRDLNLLPRYLVEIARAVTLYRGNQ